MSDFDLDKRAEHLADCHSAYSLARQVVSLQRAIKNLKDVHEDVYWNQEDRIYRMEDEIEVVVGTFMSTGEAK